MYQTVSSWLQIITESLPISSSGHVYLVQHMLHIHPEVTIYDHLVDYALHLPTAGIIALLFRQAYIPLLMHIKRTWRYGMRIIMYGFIVELITVAGYVVRAYAQIHIPLWIGFACTACVLISLRYVSYTKYSSMHAGKAVLLGCAQALALIPGISRFALTYSVCCWMGIRPMRAFEWSMLVQWPLIFVAGLYGSYMLYSVHELQLLHVTSCLSMLGAATSAYVLLCCMYTMVQRNSVWIWGLYMCIPTALAWYLNL